MYTHMILWWRVFWFDSFTPNNDGICPQWVFQILWNDARFPLKYSILNTRALFWQQLWLITHFFYIRLHLKNFPNSTEPHSVCHFLLFFYRGILPFVLYNPFESIIRNSCVDTCPGRISGRVSGRTRRRKIKMVNVSFLCKEDARAFGGGYNTDRSSYHFFLACFSFFSSGGMTVITKTFPTG